MTHIALLWQYEALAVQLCARLSTNPHQLVPCPTDIDANGASLIPAWTVYAAQMHFYMEMHRLLAEVGINFN
jgi:hypothetical protein